MATKTRRTHRNGPGLKILDKRTRWYGAGYCGICGSSDDCLIPQAVRYWDCDDGWRVGVLCEYCGEDAANTVPSPDDYAFTVNEPQAERIDLDASLSGGDLDHMVGEY